MPTIPANTPPRRPDPAPSRPLAQRQPASSAPDTSGQAPTLGIDDVALGAGQAPDTSGQAPTLGIDDVALGDSHPASLAPPTKPGIESTDVSVVTYPAYDDLAPPAKPGVESTGSAPGRSAFESSSGPAPVQRSGPVPVQRSGLGPPIRPAPVSNTPARAPARQPDPTPDHPPVQRLSDSSVPDAASQAPTLGIDDPGPATAHPAPPPRSPTPEVHSAPGYPVSETGSVPPMPATFDLQRRESTPAPPARRSGGRGRDAMPSAPARAEAPTPAATPAAAEEAEALGVAPTLGLSWLSGPAPEAAAEMTEVRIPSPPSKAPSPATHPMALPPSALPPIQRSAWSVSPGDPPPAPPFGAAANGRPTPAVTLVHRQPETATQVPLLSARPLAATVARPRPAEPAATAAAPTVQPFPSLGQPPPAPAATDAIARPALRFPTTQPAELPPVEPTVVQLYQAPPTTWAQRASAGYAPAPPEPASTPTAPTPTAATPTAPTPTAAAPTTPPGAGAGAGAAASAGDLDELSRRLYDHIRVRLKAELRLDRERAGMLTDL